MVYAKRMDIVLCAVGRTSLLIHSKCNSFYLLFGFQMHLRENIGPGSLGSHLSCYWGGRVVTESSEDSLRKVGSASWQVCTGLM